MLRLFRFVYVDRVITKSRELRHRNSFTLLYQNVVWTQECLFVFKRLLVVEIFVFPAAAQFFWTQNWPKESHAKLHIASKNNNHGAPLLGLAKYIYIKPCHLPFSLEILLQMALGSFKDVEESVTTEALINAGKNPLLFSIKVSQEAIYLPNEFMGIDYVSVVMPSKF